MSATCRLLVLGASAARRNFLARLVPGLLGVEPEPTGRRILYPTLQSTRTAFSKMSSYTVEEKGPQNSLDYRMYFKNASGSYVSPFHDIPLSPPGNTNPALFNMVVEVPRWTNAKMEIRTKEKLTPIMQDVKKEKLRFVKNCFPYHGYIWNYGAIPQTWEDPSVTDPDTGCKGDNDPLDVCEIGSRVAKRGEVIQVKVLGVLALIDEGETDWKILAIDVRDRLAKVLNDIEDIQNHMPGFIEATFDWFKIYKIPTGKPPNLFAFNSQPKNKDMALQVIKNAHAQWQNNISKTTKAAGSIAFENVSVAGSPYMIPAETAKEIVAKAPVTGKVDPSDPDVNDWHFIRRDQL